MNAREAALLNAARDVVAFRGFDLDPFLFDAMWDLNDVVDEYGDDE